MMDVEESLSKAPSWPIVTPYLVKIDSNLSLEEMIALGYYGYIDPDFNSRRFPVKRSGSRESQLFLVHFGRVKSAKQILSVNLPEIGLRAAKIEELLAFGAQYPEVQREFPIVALGSSCRGSDKIRRVPCLDGGEIQRDLDLEWYVDDWHAQWRFLAASR